MQPIGAGWSAPTSVGTPVTGWQTPPTTSPIATVQPGTPQVPTAVDYDTAIALLVRIQKVLDDAVSQKWGQINIDRSLIDEVRAEVTQVKMNLQGEKP
jgi:hypothetical protein